VRVRPFWLLCAIALGRLKVKRWACEAVGVLWCARLLFYRAHFLHASWAEIRDNQRNTPPALLMVEKIGARSMLAG
jgi:hypothetical protein